MVYRKLYPCIDPTCFSVSWRLLIENLSKHSPREHSQAALSYESCLIDATIYTYDYSITLLLYTRCSTRFYRY